MTLAKSRLDRIKDNSDTTYRDLACCDSHRLELTLCLPARQTNIFFWQWN